MRKRVFRITGLLVVLLLLVSVPLWAEEQLMTKIFFDNWLKQSTAPLESQINILKDKLAGLNQSIREIQSQVVTEIKVTIGKKTALVDGRSVTLDVAPALRNDRTMLPVRFIGEIFGAQFTWDESTRKVTYTLEGTIIELTIDKRTATINGRSVTLDTAPVIVGGRTLVPLRFVGESMGADISWDGATQTVTVLR